MSFSILIHLQERRLTHWQGNFNRSDLSKSIMNWAGDIFQKGWLQLKQPSPEIMSREGRLVLDKEMFTLLPNRWCKDPYQLELHWKKYIFKSLWKTERSFFFQGDSLQRGNKKVRVTEKSFLIIFKTECENVLWDD